MDNAQGLVATVISEREEFDSAAEGVRGPGRAFRVTPSGYFDIGIQIENMVMPNGNLAPVLIKGRVIRE